MNKELRQGLGNLLKLIAIIFVAFWWFISSLILIYYFILAPLNIEMTLKVIERIDLEIQHINSLDIDPDAKSKALNELENMKQNRIQALQDVIATRQKISKGIIKDIILFALSSFALILLLKDENRANKDENSNNIEK